MAEESLKKKTVKGVVWSGAERLIGQLVQFLIMLALARLLTPRDYGIIGMIAIFIELSQSLIDSGFSQALIRKQNRTDIDLSTVFYFNIVVSIIVYWIFFFIAPLVQTFYNEPQLKVVMRWLSIVVVINSFSVVQKAVFTINLNFKTQTIISLLSTSMSGLLGIWSAVYYRNVWALVIYQLGYSVISSMLFWIFSKWRPIVCFSWTSFKEMFNFGFKLMIVGIINTLFTNLYPIGVGKVYSTATLGFYTRAQHFANLPAMTITSIVQRVSFPVMCEIQNDRTYLTSFFVKELRLVAFVVFPVMCFLAAVSTPLVEIVLGDRWSFCGTLMIPLCFAMMWYPFHALNLNVLEMVGRSDLFLKLEIIKKIITVIVFFISIPFGIIFLCYSQVFLSIIFIIINAWYTKNYINLNFSEQLVMYIPYLIISVLTFVIIYVLGNFFNNTLLWLVIGLIGGPISYCIITRVLGYKELQMVLSLAKKAIGNKYKNKNE